MAKVRIGFSTQFELENELVGIGTDNPTNTLQALGNIHATNTKAVGVSTFTTFDGFTDTKAAISGAGGAKSGSLSSEIIIEGSVVVSSGTTFTSGPENLTVTDNFTLPGISDDKPSVGTTRFNENLAALEFYTGSEWRAVNSRVDMGTSGRGIIAGGSTGSRTTFVGYVNIMSEGNENDFGTLTDDRSYANSCSDGNRCLVAGGLDGTPFSDIIDYNTIQSGGKFVDFGNLTTDQGYGGGGCSSSTRGLFASWYPHSAIIDYVEIQTTGNALDFGDRSITVAGAPAALASPTRAVWAGGYTSGSPLTSVAQSYMDFVTISSKGNAVKFGDLTKKRGSLGGCSNTVRGVYGGGSDWAGSTYELQVIDYITIASTGNATHFGELTLGRGFGGATSTQTRGIFGGMRFAPAINNLIDYITIASTGNALDFGDLSIARKEVTMTSDSHGGLGGF